MIGAGLVGFGLAGRVFHAPAIRAVDGLQLKTIVQRSGDSAREVYPDVQVVRDLCALLADDAIRLVVIATPNTSHFELARECLLAGRDVVVDKPFTPTTQEAEELARIAAAEGRILAVHHNRRWDGDFLTVRKLIASGVLGPLVLFESRYDRYRPARRPGTWREQNQPGSGILFDLGSHLVDQALVLFGMPQAITAEVRRERPDAEVDDAFDLVLHYPTLRAVLRATMLACAPAARFLLHGRQGSFAKFGMDPQEDALKTGAIPGGPEWGAEPEDRWGTLSVCGEQGVECSTVRTERGDYRRFYENVRDAILGQAQLEVTAQQGWRVIRLLELARESSRQRATLDVRP